MLDSLTSLLPVLGGLLAGVLLKRCGAAKSADGEFLFRVVFWICVPAVTFLALATVEMTADLLIFPAGCLVATAVALVVASIVGRTRRLDRQRLMSFLLVGVITNSLFALVFAQALFDELGVARVAAYDAMNAPLIYGAMYALAARANPEHQGSNVLVGKLLKSPPLYAVVLGIALNVSGWSLPTGAVSLLDGLGTPTGFIVTLAIGIMFSPQRSDFGLASLAILIRFAVGIGVAISLIQLFGLEGIDATVMLLLGVAPCGFNAVTFASLEKLDVRFAASALSLSIPVAVVMSVLVGVVSGS